MHRYLTLVPSRLRRHITPMPRQRDAKFVSRLCRGEAGAWSQLVDQWSPHLYSYISYNAANEADTRLLLHAILSEVIQTLIVTRPIENMTILIFSVAYQHILRYRRQHPDLLSLRGRLSYGVSEFLSEQQSSFIQRLCQFTPEMQQILFLRYLCGVTMPELAEIVGQSEELLTKVLYRTRLYF